MVVIGTIFPMLVGSPQHPLTVVASKSKQSERENHDIIINQATFRYEGTLN